MSTTTIEAPARPLTQRLDALRRANDVRSRRADLKRDLKARRETVAEILARPPEYVFTMSVWDLLLATPKVGRVKASKALKACEVSPRKTLAGLSRRQRVELCEWLGER